MSIRSKIIKTAEIPALKNDPVKLILHIVQIPEQFLEDFLAALKIEAEATGKTNHCPKRDCRKSGHCHATHFNGIDHPCGINWQIETLRTIMMMQVFQVQMAGMEVDNCKLGNLTHLMAR